MRTLALDAALGPFSAALDLDGTVAAVRSTANDALEAGLGRIAALLAAGGIGLGALDRIAVGVGPGSFTGIRIALSYAKAMAYGADVPLTGISSYDVITPEDLTGCCLAVVGGRPGVICARFHSSGGSLTACGAPAAVIERLSAGRDAKASVTVAAASDALAELAPIVPPAWKLVAADLSNPAQVIARLARRVPAAAWAHAVVPDYGELPAVTIPKGGTEVQR